MMAQAKILILTVSLAVISLFSTGCRDSSSDGFTEQLTDFLVTEYLKTDWTHISSCRLTRISCMNYMAYFSEPEARAHCENAGMLYSRDADSCDYFVSAGAKNPCDYFDGGYPEGVCPSTGSAYSCKYPGVKKSEVVYYSIPAGYDEATMQTDCESAGGTWTVGY